MKYILYTLFSFITLNLHAQSGTPEKIIILADSLYKLISPDSCRVRLEGKYEFEETKKQEWLNKGAILIEKEPNEKISISDDYKLEIAWADGNKKQPITYYIIMRGLLDNYIDIIETQKTSINIDLKPYKNQLFSAVLIQVISNYCKYTEIFPVYLQKR